MSIEEKLKLILTFDDLVKRKLKGNGLDYAVTMGISRSTFFRLLEVIKYEFNAPVVYNKERNRYEYEREGAMFFGFITSTAMPAESLKTINGGHVLKHSLNYFKNILASLNCWD